MGSITTSFMTNGCSRTNTCVQPSASKPWPRAPSAADSLWSPKSDADPSWTYQALVSELPKERSTCSSLGHRRPEVCQQENSWVRSTIRPEAGIQPAFGDQATPTFEDSVHVEGQESFFLPPSAQRRVSSPLSVIRPRQRSRIRCTWRARSLSFFHQNWVARTMSPSKPLPLYHASWISPKRLLSDAQKRCKAGQNLTAQDLSRRR